MQTKDEITKKIKEELNRVDPCCLKFQELRYKLDSMNSEELKDILTALERKPSIFIASRLEPVKQSNRNYLYNYCLISKNGIQAEFSRS